MFSAVAAQARKVFWKLLPVLSDQTEVNELRASQELIPFTGESTFTT